jgi:LmbE family N-acetylglucosaminyl deacetylase
MTGDKVPGTIGARRALVLAPHTDDEYGCAGTIARLLREGSDVRYVALSRCEESVPEPLPKDILESECRECAEALGMSAQNVDVWSYRVRHFPASRQDILERFVRIAREYSPDLVLLPSSSDMHQDHATVSTEGFRAFKHSSIFGYELPQNVISFENSAFVKLTEADLDRKVEALTRYRSQAFRPYAAGEFIRGLAMVRGVQCNARFAEAFEVIRLVV